MGRQAKTPNDELDKFLLRMPDGLRERLKATAEENNRSMNAEIVGRLEFSLIMHPNAYLIRALIDLQEKLLAGKDELTIPRGLQEELRERAHAIGMAPQKYLIALLLETINELDEQTELGQEFAKRVSSQIESATETEVSSAKKTGRALDL